MNISHPVSSAISAVDFGFYTTEDIKQISVKQIHNPETFDTLLHPTPGGLYDTALGSFQDNLCTTCYQNAFHCPGHCGHIELPVPVYHVSLLDQLQKILNAQCASCHRLRYNRQVLDLYACKLRLLRYGLLGEFPELERITLKSDSNARGVAAADEDEEEDSLDDAEASEDIIQRRNAFVKKAIRKAIIAAGGKEFAWTTSREKVESVTRERRNLIRELLSAWDTTRTCSLCNHVSPRYRKNGANKIFRKLLSQKDTAKNAQQGRKTVNPLVANLQAKRAMEVKKVDDHGLDEGVADLSEESEDQDVEMMERGVELDAHGLVDEAAGIEPKKPPEKGVKQLDQFVNASEIHAALTLLFERDGDILNLIYDSRAGTKYRPLMDQEIFFIRYLLVTPNRYRPTMKSNSGGIIEAEQNTLYRNILRQCDLMAAIQKEVQGAPLENRSRRRDFIDFQNAWVVLQDHVNGLIDSNYGAIRPKGNLKPAQGIKQIMEKKEGLFRMNMMGKRVNFAARSVISPDPNIETNEIGVPPVFASKLTYPEPVGEHNVRVMKERVLNGPEKYPGAVAVEDESGQIINLRHKSFEERKSIASMLMQHSDALRNTTRNKKVHRHLQSGDIVIMNRQPTLHKPSMMGHRARVLLGEKTIRMHYANCNTYNADFDGDEMNMHLPQNEISRAEASQIADTDHQYLVATSGKPLRGLIQDHLSISVWICSKDMFFTRSEYHELLYSCLRPENNHTIDISRIETVPPAIIKPRAMWTGKQVVTTVLRNVCPRDTPGITLSCKCQIPGERWEETHQESPLEHAHSEEGMVFFHRGDFLHGILDKNQLGPSPKGLVHSVYELYGPTVTGKLLSILGRLLTRLLHVRAFSCGMEDITLSPEGDQLRKEKLKGADVVGLEVASKYVSIEGEAMRRDPELLRRLEAVFRDDKKLAGLDVVVSKSASSLSSKITEEVLPRGLHIDFPKNQMQTMTTSGAKGTIVNANQISCNLGQQALEGRRVPVMASGKSLPSFQPFETKIRAGGYVVDRFFSGVKPQEYYFHTMAGREGLVDTAVKTARSGYLQRCLIKGMEGLRVQYDTSVRDSDGSMIQFLYGEDGLDVTRRGRLDDFPFLAENLHAVVDQLRPPQKGHKIFQESEVESYRKKTVKKFLKTDRPSINDPVLSLFDPASNLGSTSDKFTIAVGGYTSENPQRILKDKRLVPHPQNVPDEQISKKQFAKVLDLKYMKTVIDAGEAVGIVAGQSIGEPSTQMTLNTFHLAGHAAKNVTLGIPRLREIVMTASAKISTPTMTIYLHEDATEDEGKRFAQGLTRLSLGDVVDKVTIVEVVSEGRNYQEAKIFEIRIDFFPVKEYTEFYNIKRVDVLRSVEYSFVPLLTKVVRKAMKAKGDEKLLKDSNAAPDIGNKVKPLRGEQDDDRANLGDDGGDVEERTGVKDGDDGRERNDDDSDESDEDSDDDADENHQKREKGLTSYEDVDDEEKELSRAARSTSEEQDDDNVPEDEGYAPSPRSGDESDSMAESTAEKATKYAAKGSKDRLITKHPELTRFHFDHKADYCTLTLEYDATTAKIILLDLVESAVRQANIQHIPGIGSATLFKDPVRDPVTGSETEVPTVLTEGVNIGAMHDYQNVINPHKIFTNDVHEMLRIYGIEAALATIMREMNAVFQSHGITVDHRHLSLIAAFMTRSGDFVPFNRNGMRNGVSPFHKMSFETTINFLKEALLDGDWDDLKNPSASLVVGKLPAVGTGTFDVLLPVEVRDEPLPPMNILRDIQMSREL